MIDFYWNENSNQTCNHSGGQKNLDSLQPTQPTRFNKPMWDMLIHYHLGALTHQDYGPTNMF